MRSHFLSSAQRPDEAGIRIAEEFKGFFAAARSWKAQRTLETQQRLSVTGTLRAAVYRSVNSYNERAPLEFQVVVLDRGDRLLFRVLGQLTLTLHYGSEQVMLEMSDGGAQAAKPMTLEVWRDGEGLRFRAVPDSDLFPAAILTEVQFVYSVIRMACSRSFDGVSDKLREC